MGLRTVGISSICAVSHNVDLSLSLQICEQHQSSPPVSNTSCGYRELTLLYCLVLSLPSKSEQRDIRTLRK